MSQSARVMPRTSVRRSLMGTSSAHAMDNGDGARSVRPERVPTRSGRKKTRAQSVRTVGSGVSGADLSPRSPRKPAIMRRNKSLGNMQLPPNFTAEEKRNTVDSNNKIRRVRKSKDNGDEASDDGSKRSRRSKKSLSSKKSVRSRSKSKLTANDDDNNSRRSIRRERSISVRRERIQETKLLAMEAASADTELQTKVESLQSKIVDLKQEQLNAQSASMQLNKEKRELKLELQRSQTVVRELRAEIRERDLTVKQATEKMETLEQGIETQLGKVEDLEDELRRANDEIFTLEEKLQHMELQLAESEAGDGHVNDAEPDFEAKRRERQERRLKEKEKELEKRERELQEKQNAASSRTSFGVSSTANNKQLEQDNRMLLKALNREKDNSVAKLKAKEEEIKRLNEKIGKFLGGKGGNFNADIMEENRILAEQLDEEKESHADTITIKDEKIAKLETQLRQLQLNSSREKPREQEAYKTEAIDLRKQLEIAQQRNSLLEDEIDNWKAKNMGMDHELTQLKEKINKYRSKANNTDSFTARMNSSMNMSYSSLADSGRKEDNGRVLDEALSDDEEDRGGKGGIGNLWNRVTKMSTRDVLTSPNRRSGSRNAEDFISRKTFH